MTPQKVICPMQWEDFLSEFLGEKPYINCSIDRDFRALLTWDEINRIILEHRLEHPRLRMFKNVQLVPAHNYMNRTTSRRGSVSPTILMREFNEEILSGATLIIDAIQEMSPKIRELCESFNFALKGVCQANAYIALADQQAFDTHWDGHDVFVLQVSGEKHWKIYSPTRLHPLDTDLDKNITQSTNKEMKLFWEGTIKSGDVLYIPRGWWHSVSPVGKETIHISIGYNPPTGVDYLKWISNQLLKFESFRKSSPVFSNNEKKDNYIEEIRNLVNSEISINSYKKHIQDRIGKLSPRVSPTLPYSSDPKITTLPEYIRVRASHKNIFYENTGESTTIIAFNKRYSVSSNNLKVIEVLFNEKNDGLSISQIYAKCINTDKHQANKFVLFLMRLGLLQIC